MSAKGNEKRETEYFASLDGEELVQALLRRFDSHVARMQTSGRHRRIMRVWNTYYSFDPNQGGKGNDTSSVKHGGRQGETTLVKPARLRGVIQRLLNMNAGSQPAWDCVALNTDSEASRQARIGDNVIEHYGSAHKLYERLLERDEHAFVMAEAFIAAPWDPNRGSVHAYKDVPELDRDGRPIEDEAQEQQEQPDPESGEPHITMVTVRKPRMRQLPVHAGDFRFLVLTPYDCALVGVSDDNDAPAAVIFRYYVNKWDMAALYPLHAEDIARMESCSAERSQIGIGMRDDEDDKVAVYEAHVVKSPACPEGLSCRFMRGISEPLSRAGLAYKRLPVFRTSPGDVILGEGGHSPGIDVLQLTELYAAVLSAAITAQEGNGKRVFRLSKNAGLAERQIGSATFLQMDDNAQLQRIDMSSDMGDTMTLLGALESNEDFVTGLNAAARGDAQAMKGDSGAKGALVLSAAQQMQTRFQRSRQLADSSLFTHIIDTLKTHATVERVIEIAGKANTYDALTFKGSDLKGISRVYVHQANPLKDTPEGRAQLMEGYLKLGVIKTPEDMYQVATTGQLAHVEHPYTSQLTLIDQENEMMADPENAAQVPVLPDDPHELHLMKHLVVQTSMSMRRNTALLRKYMEHTMQHRQYQARMTKAGAKMPEPLSPSDDGKARGGSADMMRGAKPTSGPDMPRAPVNPATGERAQIAPVPELQPQVPA